MPTKPKEHPTPRTSRGLQPARPHATRRAIWVAAPLALALGLAATTATYGQSFKSEISARRADLGESLTLLIKLIDVTTPKAPVPPETDDFDIRLVNPIPSKNQIVIGRRSRRVEYGYRFEVRPRRLGRLRLPPFTVDLNGKRDQTAPILIAVEKGPAGPFFDCAVQASANRVFLGQTIDLKLMLWVRKFSQGRFELSLNDTWRLLRLNQSNAGIFADADFSRPKYSQSRRADDDGVMQEFYVFQVDLVATPTRAGPLDFGPIELVYEYPVRLERSGFGLLERLSIARSRVIRSRPKSPSVEIKPIPTAGRPADFNGAIGPHTITARATPTEVPVGDPITLSLTLRGTGPLDRLSAPRLDRVEALTDDFEVPAESLAGELTGGGKTFTLTVRALRDDVTEIPPIPLSFFDPRTESFRTVRTDAIPLTVTPAERLALTLPEDGATGGRLAPLVETTEGLMANTTDPSEVLADQSGRIATHVWIILAALPAVYLGTWLIQRRTLRLRDDTALRRRGKAMADARRRLAAAGGADAHAHLAGAVLGYIADRCNAPAGGMTRADAARLLGERKAPAATVQAVDRLLASVEQAQYAGTSAVDGGQLASAAGQVLSELEKLKLK